MKNISKKIWKMHSKNDIIPINQHNGGKPMRKWKKAGTIGLIAVMLCVSGAGCKEESNPRNVFFKRYGQEW